MRDKLVPLALAATLIPWSLASAQATAPDSLALEVYTADSSGFGVTSTLIYGKTEAILVDAQFRLSDAERLAERIAATGKRLKAIVITHPHPDHYFGLAVLRRRFPSTPVYMSRAGLEEFNRTVATKIATWSPAYGAEVPTAVPEPFPLPTPRFTIDGHAVEVIPDQQGDVIARTNSFVWVPSLRAAIVSDLAYDGTHVWLAESDTVTRPAWQSTLRRIAGMRPQVVVAGHKRSPDAPNDPEVLAFTGRYITDFEAARTAAQSPEQLIAAMKQKHPDLGLDVILTFAANAAFPAVVPQP